MRTLVLLILIALFSCESSLESNNADRLDSLEISEAQNDVIAIGTGGGSSGGDIIIIKPVGKVYYQAYVIYSMNASDDGGHLFTATGNNSYTALMNARAKYASSDLIGLVEVRSWILKKNK